MINHRLECIDIGSDYCPCYLAELNECIVCSQLQGKEFCDCNWNGVCVYQDFIWSKRKAKAKRETIVADIIDKQSINKNLIILTLSVPNKMARDLNEPGSYVFLRNELSPSFFDAPMSVMYVDEINGIIKIAVQINGPKTNLINSCGKRVFFKRTILEWIVWTQIYKRHQKFKMPCNIKGYSTSTWSNNHKQAIQ